MVLYDKKAGVIEVPEGQEIAMKEKYPEAIEVDEIPSEEYIKDWSMDGGCETPDGCWVEEDGICEHGYPSWLRIMGLI